MLSETEQLREVGSSLASLVVRALTGSRSQDLKILEEDVEKSLAREEVMVSGGQPPSPSTPSLDDIHALQRSYKDLKSKHEVSIVKCSGIGVRIPTISGRPRWSNSGRSLQKLR